MQQIIKKHLTLLLVLLASMATFTSCDDDEGYAIDVRDLPSQAWDFLDYYYYDIPVVEAFYYGSGSDGYYRVNLADGTGIGFDAWGKWYFVSAPWDSSVPAGIIPLRIINFVGYYYPYEAIVSITITGYGYDIILSNGTELSFDHYGEVYD